MATYLVCCAPFSSEGHYGDVGDARPTEARPLDGTRELFQLSRSCIDAMFKPNVHPTLPVCRDGVVEFARGRRETLVVCGPYLMTILASSD